MDTFLEKGRLLFEGHWGEFDMGNGRWSANPDAASVVGEQMEYVVGWQVSLAGKVLALVPGVGGLGIGSPNAFGHSLAADGEKCKFPDSTVGGGNAGRAAGGTEGGGDAGAV